MRERASARSGAALWGRRTACAIGGWLLLCAAGPLRASDTGVTDAPGFRPDAGAAARTFVESSARASLAVLPAAWRTTEGVTSDQATAELAANELRARQIVARVEVRDSRLALPVLAGGGPQFQAFQQQLAALEPVVAELKLENEYALLIELLITPRRNGGQAVGGVHCYVLTRDGQNAFSFLLNSHHRMFAEANLRTDGADAEARREIAERATRLAIEALAQQTTAAGRKARGG